MLIKKITAIIAFAAIFLLTDNGYTYYECINNNGKKYYTNSLCKESSIGVAKVDSADSQKINSEVINNKCNDHVNLNLSSGFYNNISLNIIDVDCFFDVKKSNIKSRPGFIYLGFLITIENKGDFPINGGSSDNHSTFNVITNDGYTIQSENTSSDMWKNNRIVFNSDIINPGDLSKGWIIFEIPKVSKLKKLNFNVDKSTSPHRFEKIGLLNIEL